MDYFFIDPKDIQGNVALIRGEEFRHLSRVVRKKEGERVMLLDGADTTYEAVIRLIDRIHAECEIIGMQQRANEPRIDITLAVSLLRNPARFDVLVEKATELGVRTIVPLLCERTVPKSDKHSRLEKIALSALKQCGRSHLPRIQSLISFDVLLAESIDYSLRLIPHEKTEQSQFIGAVLQHHANLKSVLIVIGPEGGFSEHEVSLAAEKGFVPISLGPRRLRAETAAISAVSWVVGGW
jgi:16S rRNA (uracil1498-N3)-methyltransferase